MAAPNLFPYAMLPWPYFGVSFPACEKPEASTALARLKGSSVDLTNRFHFCRGDNGGTGTLESFTVW